MNNNNNNDFLNILSQKLGHSPESLKKSAQSGDMTTLLSSLSPHQREMVSSILGDPEKTKKLMENPGVQSIIKKFSQNG